MAHSPDVPHSYINGRHDDIVAGGRSVDPLLEQMTQEIQARIAEVERRHSDALLEMQSKLERLSGDAERARPAMPPALATAFRRIEAGMADLVHQIGETVPERRRGAEAFVFGEPKSDHSHFVFNPPSRAPIAPVNFDGEPTGEAWDRDAADALARMYESGEAALAKHLPEAALFAPGAWARDAEKNANPSVAAMPEVSRQMDMPSAQNQSANDQDWTEQRFAALNQHISETIRNARPDGALDLLMARVDQFEARFTTAMDGLATMADLVKVQPDALQKVEAQLKDLAGHLESAQLQLSRLDAIEQHLADLNAFAHASMDESNAPVSAAAPTAPTDHDMARMAELAVDRALARTPNVAAITDPSLTQAHAAEMQALLDQFAAERRRGDEQTTGMLETIQEALIRLIDRIDVIDAGIGGLNSNPDVPQATPEQAHVDSGAPAGHEMATPVGAPVASRDDSAVAAAAPDDEARSARPIRRRERRVIETATDVKSAEIANEGAPENAGRRPSINIKDLRINLDRSEVASPDDETQRAPSADIAAAAGRGARRLEKQLPPDVRGTGKRGIVVAAAALSLVGVTYLASLLLSDRYNTQNLSATASIAPPEIKVPQIGAAGQPQQVSKPAQSGSVAASPPGMIGVPARPDLKATPLAPSAGATAPSGLASQVGGNTKSGAVQQQPGSTNLDFTPTKPVSMPETATDDLSQADVSTQDDSLDMKTAVASASQPSTTTTQLMPMQGMAVVPAGDHLQAGEVAAAQRQASMAEASERMGLRARPADMFSQRFGQPQLQPAPAAAQPKPIARVAANPAAIVTGSAPLQPVSLNQAPTDAAVDAVAGNVEMPPALVGPLSLRIAAQKGDPSATFEVATRFAEGRGPKQDYNLALTWYQRSAAKGFAVAQYRLGTLYERGLGTTADPARAKLWYKRAAEQGNVKAMHNLAVLSAGNGQSAPDYATAAKWFGQAAEYGLPDSQFNLGVLYENGLGVAKDQATAYFWYSLAAHNGDQEAARRRDRLLGTLDVAILKGAEDRVGSWHGRVSDSKVNDARVAGDLWRNRVALTDETAGAVPTDLRAQPLPN